MKLIKQPHGGAIVRPAKGETANPNGRPKGVKNLATIVRELEAEDFDWAKIPIKQKDAAQAIGSPWRAIVFTAIGMAMSGNVKAMEWLRKSGYGDKLDITTAGDKIEAVQVTIVNPNENKSSVD